MAEEIIYTMKGVGKVYPPNRYVLKNIYQIGRAHV